jgi:hypothetical protein
VKNLLSSRVKTRMPTGRSLCSRAAKEIRICPINPFLIGTAYLK